MRKKKFPLLIILLFVFIFALAGCQKGSEQADESPDGTSQTPAAAEETAAGVPTEILVKADLQTAVDADCLKDKGKFALNAASMPRGGLKPGMTHTFCVTGVPAGETVQFTLRSPDGSEQTFQAISTDQGGVTAALQPIAIGADAKEGKWTLTASYQDQSDSLGFKVRKADQPFIVLSEPVANDPSDIRIAIGGVKPNSMARFAVYRLQPGQSTGDAVESRGELLMENSVMVDETGRADLVLDVSQQPEGAYLVALFPEEGGEGATATINLPEQERSAVAVTIRRGSTVATNPPQNNMGEAGETTGSETPSIPANAPAVPPAYTPGEVPPAPKLTEAGGGLPETVNINLPDAELPPCNPTSAPAIQLWPSSGQVGQWWYGCASGFAPDHPLRVDAVLGTGQTVSFDLTRTSADGTKGFRWYSLPEEGNGVFKILISDLTGNKATASWTIASPTKPHLLVYPHVVIKDVGAQLSLVGFPKRTSIAMGIYQLDDNGAAGTATLVKKIRAKVNKHGMLQRSFDASNELKPGIYMLVAQSSPTYKFPGIDIPATAVEFFSVGAPIPEKYEFYTLFIGRKATGLVASSAEESAPASETPAASGEEETTASSPATGELETVPRMVKVPVNEVEAPSCPDSGNEPTICMMPTVTQRSTYVYMLAQGFKSGTKFVITVAPPKGAVVKFVTKANNEGIADAHWYALNNEPLGTYDVRIRGGGEKFTGNFEVVEATSPHLVVQPRSPRPGTSVIISFSGVESGKTYVVARYRATDDSGGQVRFQLMDSREIQADNNGGAHATFKTKKADKGTLFLAVLYEKGNAEALAKEVYAPGKELYLAYPFGWGQGDLEGN